MSSIHSEQVSIPSKSSQELQTSIPFLVSLVSTLFPSNSDVWLSGFFLLCTSDSGNDFSECAHCPLCLALYVHKCLKSFQRDLFLNKQFEFRKNFSINQKQLDCHSGAEGRSCWGSASSRALGCSIVRSRRCPCPRNRISSVELEKNTTLGIAGLFCLHVDSIGIFSKGRRALPACPTLEHFGENNEIMY